MCLTLCGISNDGSDEYEKARDQIRANPEPNSNEQAENDQPNKKHSGERISTQSGIKTDRSDEHMNADDSIRVNREFDTNEIDESDPQDEKQPEQRIPTLRGMRTDSGHDEGNANDSIDRWGEPFQGVIGAVQRREKVPQTGDPA
jgi:hypothetical protein